MKNLNNDLIKATAIDGCLFKKALDDLELLELTSYSDKITNQEDYKSGWNDAIKEQFAKYIAFNNFISSLEKHQRKAFENLLINDIIELSYTHRVSMLININDVFVPAADGETIYIDNLIEINNIYNKFGFDGIIAWIAHTRGTEPLSYKYKKNYKYRKAYKYIKSKQNGRGIALNAGLLFLCCIVGATFGAILNLEFTAIGMFAGSILYLLIFIISLGFKNG